MGAFGYYTTQTGKLLEDNMHKLYYREGKLFLFDYKLKQHSLDEAR